MYYKYTDKYNFRLHKEMEFFERLDNFFWISGLKFITYNRFQRSIKAGLLIFTLFNILSCTYHDSTHFIIRPAIFTFGDYLFWASCWICYLALFCRRKQMLKLLTIFDTGINKKSRRNLSILTMKLMTMIVLYYFVLLVTQTPLSFSPREWKWKIPRITIFGENPVFSPLTVTVTYLFRLHEVWVTNWMSIAVALYTFFHRLMTYYFIDQMEYIKSKVRPDKILINLTGISSVSDLKQIHKLIRIQEDFENIFNVYPFLALVQNFFLVSAYILHIFQDDSTNQYYRVVMQYALMQAVQLILPFALIQFVNYDQKLLKLSTEDMIVSFCSCGRRDLILFRSMRCLTKKTPTAFNTFTLDNSLIPSFAGSLLSFSVLFLQLPQLTVSKG